MIRVDSPAVWDLHEEKQHLAEWGTQAVLQPVPLFPSLGGVRGRRPQLQGQRRKGKAESQTPNGGENGRGALKAGRGGGKGDPHQQMIAYPLHKCPVCSVRWANGETCPNLVSSDMFNPVKHLLYICLPVQVLLKCCFLS
jgi:hypothetical protein